jgi:hypothetical protein
VSDGRSREEIATALARADAQIARGKAFYEHRNRVAVLTGLLPLPDLVRLTGILNRLSSSDLLEVLAFAEGLAEWSDSGPQLPDGSQANAAGVPGS